jgi:hypothetical protein
VYPHLGVCRDFWFYSTVREFYGKTPFVAN